MLMFTASASSGVHAPVVLFARVDNLCDASYQEVLEYRRRLTALAAVVPSGDGNGLRWDLGQASR
jgi:hypothetical protein